MLSATWWPFCLGLKALTQGWITEAPRHEWAATCWTQSRGLAAWCLCDGAWDGLGMVSSRRGLICVLHSARVSPVARVIAFPELPGIYRPRRRPDHTRIGSAGPRQKSKWNWLSFASHFDRKFSLEAIMLAAMSVVGDRGERIWISWQHTEVRCWYNLYCSIHGWESRCWLWNQFGKYVVI